MHAERDSWPEKRTKKMKLSEAGVIWTSPRVCRPLDDVDITFSWNGLRKGQKVRLVVIDGNHVAYHEGVVTANKGELTGTVRAGRFPGVHYVQAHTRGPDGGEYHRYGTFRVETRTGVSSDNPIIDETAAMLEEGTRQAVDTAQIDGRRVPYYKHADNTWDHVAFPAYSAAGQRYFVADMKTMFELQYDKQQPDGMLPDHIYGPTYPGYEGGLRTLRTLMADLEFGSVSCLYRGWQANGDNAWLETMLPNMEKSLRCALSSPLLFDKKSGLVKRAHSCDEWDVAINDDIEDGGEMGGQSLLVLMQGDASGVYEACGRMAELYEVVGRSRKADYWRKRQAFFYRQGNKVFWDGIKYRHHVHLTPFDHGTFDEDDQLAMSNSWAMTRGFANHRKSVSIINEYLRRKDKTPSRLCWWSLQPGYPDELGYFRVTGAWSMAQGEYCNGGLFPWVGAEVCRAAFMHGMEQTGYEMLRELHDVMKRDNGGLFTWYDLDGNPGINAPHNQTNYDMWGLSHWTQALLEEAAGIQSEGKVFETVLCSPKWPSCEVRRAEATAHFPASDTYFTYRYSLTPTRVRIDFTGTGRTVKFRVLLPSNKQCTEALLDGKKRVVRERTVESSVFACLNAKIAGTHELELKLR